MSAQTLRFADMFAALGSEARLGILRLLLTSHPLGMVAGEIQSETGITPSTLSHHLERLKHEGLVSAQREGVYLRYSANAEALTELLSFLYEECCTRSQAVSGAEVVVSCKPKRAQK